MYLEFYQLREQPFNITPDPRFLYMARHHQEALDHLLYGVAGRKGFMELVGEVGCGKTTLCRALLGRLPAGVKSALILNPTLTETQLIRAILHDLGVPTRERDRLLLIEQLNEFLLVQCRAGINVLVILDEAQKLSAAVMEQVRLLSNLETDQHKLLQIILAGQPELKQRLAAEDLRQLRQRIMVRCALMPLGVDETRHYIEHRLTVAGGSAAIIPPDLAMLIHQRSGGIPRVINALCDHLLLAGYVAGHAVADETDWQRAAHEWEKHQ